MIYKIIGRIKTHIFSFYAFLVFRKKVTAFGKFFVDNHARKVTIGNNCRINRGVYIQGRSKVTIGDNVVFSTEVMILDSGLDIDSCGIGDLSIHIDSYVIIEDNVWVGSRAIILPGVRIGRNTIIGAGSVVTKDFPSHVIIAGNPAKIIKHIGQEK